MEYVKDTIASIVIWLIDNIERILYAFLVVALVSSVWLMTLDDSARFTKHSVDVKSAWSSWISYRDENCKVVKKTYGIATENGKFHSNDNMVAYMCNDGIEYDIAQSIEEDVDHCYQDRSDCRANIDRIPKISRDE